jgi:hypothetical protein
MDDINEVVQLGFRLGPALNAARQQGGQHQAGDGTGTRLRPHRRRGHYHTYWTGRRGSQVPKLRWVAPYWVSQDLLGEEGPQTVVVRKVRKRPE